MDDTGLYFYNARYYDPLIGRFISTDTVVPDFINPQAYNRYSYVLNNPLKYTDPSGHWGIFSLIGAVVGATVGAIVNTVSYIVTHQEDFSLGAMVGNAIVGAVTGAVIGGTFGAVGWTLTTARVALGVNTAGQVAEQLIDTGQIDPIEAVADATIATLATIGGARLIPGNWGGDVIGHEIIQSVTTNIASEFGTNKYSPPYNTSPHTMLPIENQTDLLIIKYDKWAYVEGF